jgi:hypothetical protein
MARSTNGRTRRVREAPPPAERDNLRLPVLLVAFVLSFAAALCFGAANAAAAPSPAASAAAAPSPAASAADAQLLGTSFDNWGSPSFTWSLGEEIDWDDERWDFVAAKGVARYGKTFLFRHYGDDKTIQAVPYKFPLPPDGDKPPQRDGNLIKVLGRDDYDKFLGVCEIGSPRPDIWAFYTKKGDDSRVYWRQHTQQYNVEHSLLWPSDQLRINGQRMTPSMLFRVDGANWNRFVGRAVAFNGGLAFVGKTAYWDSMVYVVTIDPNAPQQAKIWSRSYTWGDSGGHPSAVDACSVNRDGKEVLVVGTVTGQEASCPDRWKPFGRWTNPKGYIDYFDTNGANTLHKELPIPGVAEWDRKWVSPYGPRAIQLVQGGLDQSSSPRSPNNLQIFLQDGGTNGNSYPFNAEVLTEIEWSLSHDSLSGRIDHFANTTRYSAGSETRYQEVNFMVFPVLANRPDLKNGEYVGLSQYIYVATAHVSNNDSKPFGFVTAFKSDTLAPVKSEQSEGHTITYPDNLEMSDDPATWDLLGVVYGPPPFSLQGYGYDELRKGSRFSFKNSTGEKSKLSAKVGGSVQLSQEFFGIGCSATFGIDYKTAKETSTDADVEFSFKHEDASQAEYGYFICNRPHYEIQPYTRKTWWGEDIPNSRIYVTNCTDKEGDATLSFYPFNMVKPDTSAVSKGMRAHARASDYTALSWKADPMAGAGDNWRKLSQALLSADTRGGDTTTSITKGEEKSSSLGMTVKHQAKYEWIKAEFHFGVTSESSLSNAKNTSAYLGLDTPKSGAKGSLVRRLEVETYWMQADTSNAYWIPEAFRTNGNDQKPWCVDYRVRAWEPYSSGAGAGDEASTCSVAVIALPGAGGTVTIAPFGGGAVEENAVDVAAGGKAAVTAVEADGYEFAGWEAQGGQVQIADAKAAQTTVDVTGAGGATVAAVFEPVLPDTFVVKRRSASSADILVRGADLPAQLDIAGADMAGMDLGVNLGEDSFDCPEDAWTGDGPVQTCSFQPEGWGAGSRLTLRVNHLDGTWSFRATKAKGVADFLLDCAAGQASLNLALTGEGLAFDTLPVTTEARIVQAATPKQPSGGSGGETAPGAKSKTQNVRRAVDLRKAVVATSVGGDAADTRFALTGVRLSKRLLNPRGFMIVLNGNDIPVGPFKASGAARVYRGTLLGGVRVKCTYTSAGRLGLELSGPYLPSLLGDLVGQNVSLRVVNGKTAAEGNMIAAVKSLSDVDSMANAGR